jgi:KDO2-lipid IV(A) lauroyltransferase
LRAFARGVLVRVGLAIAALAFFVVRVRRAHVQASLERAGLCDAPAGGAGSKAAWKVYRELGTSLGELLAVAAGVATPGDFVTIDDDVIARIERARVRGNVVLLCAHLSCWELVAMRAAQAFPLALVVKPLSVRATESFIRRARARAGVSAISVNGALTGVARAHARGEVVATVIDQAPARREHGDLVPFLGAPALVDRGPALMAKRARATAFVMVSSRSDARVGPRSDARVGPRSDAGRVRVEIADEISPEEIARTDATALGARATAALDAHVRAHPESWLWMHRRWKDVAPRATRARVERHARSGQSFIGREKAVIDAG